MQVSIHEHIVLKIAADSICGHNVLIRRQRVYILINKERKVLSKFLMLFIIELEYHPYRI